MCFFLHLSLLTAKSLQSCLTLRPRRRQPTRLPYPWDSSDKNTGVGCHFLLQCMKVKVKLLSRVRPSATPWTAVFQVPPSMGFSRQEYWSGVPLPSPYLHWVLSILDCSPSDWHKVASPFILHFLHCLCELKPLFLPYWLFNCQHLLVSSHILDPFLC